MEYYFEFLTPETIKLLGYTKSKIIKDKNSEDVSHLKITFVLLYLSRDVDFHPLLKIWMKNIGKNISNNLSGKYSQKLLDHHELLK